jgi:hypothetical protein
MVVRVLVSKVERNPDGSRLVHATVLDGMEITF